eukprot:Sdes_comp9184_c0_seq1m655
MIVNMELGSAHLVKLDLSAMVFHIRNRPLLFQFLLRRMESQSVLLKLFRDCLYEKPDTSFFSSTSSIVAAEGILSPRKNHIDQILHFEEEMASSPLVLISKLFHVINSAYKAFLTTSKISLASSGSTQSYSRKLYETLDEFPLSQSELYSNIFCPCFEDSSFSFSFKLGLLISYIHSL